MTNDNIRTDNIKLTQKFTESLDEKIRTNEKLKNKKIKLLMNHMVIYNFDKANTENLVNSFGMLIDKIADSLIKIDSDGDIEIDMSHITIDYLKSDKICRFCNTTTFSDFEESVKNICIKCARERNYYNRLK